MNTESVEIRLVDYADPQQAADLVRLMNCYARDPMGGGKALDEVVKQNLVGELARVPGAFSLLAYQSENAIGLINCLMGFSTFQARPLVNIHDVIVMAEQRGQGIAGQLLSRVEQIARERGCCKLTLEVLEGNRSAQRAYSAIGFAPYQLDVSTGNALFWQKPLSGE